MPWPVGSFWAVLRVVLTFARFADTVLWAVSAIGFNVLENEWVVVGCLSKLVFKDAGEDPDIANSIFRVAALIGNSSIDSEVLAVWLSNITT